MSETLIEAAEAVLDASKGSNDALIDALSNLRAALARAEKAEAELERLAKDAERYRFMRDQAHPLERYDYATQTDNGVSCYHMVDGVRELKSGAELDAAIDAAIEQEKKE